MSKVKCMVAGGAQQTLNVADGYALMDVLGLENYTLTVNGNKVDADYEFEDGDTAVLTENVKGGL